VANYDNSLDNWLAREEHARAGRCKSTWKHLYGGVSPTAAEHAMKTARSERKKHAWGQEPGQQKKKDDDEG